MTEQSGYQDTGSLDQPVQPTEVGPDGQPQNQVTEAERQADANNVAGNDSTDGGDGTGAYDPPGVATPAEQDAEEQSGNAVADGNDQPGAGDPDPGQPAPGSTGTSGGVGSE